MKAFSVKQPFTSLLIRGLKRYETRSWPAPRGLIGERIAICASKSTKTLRFELEEDRWVFCAKNGLQEKDLPFAAVVGGATLVASIPMTKEFIAGMSEQELMMGHFEIGRHAWQFDNPEPLVVAVPVSGRLGFFDWCPPG